MMYTHTHRIDGIQGTITIEDIDHEDKILRITLSAAGQEIALDIDARVVLRIAEKCATRLGYRIESAGGERDAGTAG